MQSKYSMDLLICQAQNGFSWGELVQKVAKVYKNKAFSEIFRMILQTVRLIFCKITKPCQIYAFLHSFTLQNKKL